MCIPIVANLRNKYEGTQFCFLQLEETAYNFFAAIFTHGDNEYHTTLVWDSIQTGLTQ